MAEIKSEIVEHEHYEWPDSTYTSKAEKRTVYFEGRAVSCVYGHEDWEPENGHWPEEYDVEDCATAAAMIFRSGSIISALKNISAEIEQADEEESKELTVIREIIARFTDDQGNR